jgi:hypothetical protein
VGNVLNINAIKKAKFEVSNSEIRILLEDILD